jgi:hypothetical protein
VFDVELDSGAKLKLAMDAHENPYIVADRCARTFCRGIRLFLLLCFER